MTPPGRLTRAALEMLVKLREARVPFLRGINDADLRTLALGLRAAVRHRLRGPLVASPRGLPEAVFATLCDNDSIEILADNHDAFEVKCAAVAAAKSSIDCTAYYIADDPSGRRFEQTLLEARSRGVRVRVCVDAYATIEKTYGPFGFENIENCGAIALLERLRQGGCEVFALGGDRVRTHRKFLLIDRGSELILGGRNVATHYTEPGWRDVELHVRGSLARAICDTSDQSFTLDTHVPSNSTAGVVAGVPGTGGEAFIAYATALFRLATRTVDIEHAYILSPAWLLREVHAAVRRGVRVRAITNCGATNDLPFMNFRLATAAVELACAGAQVFRRRPGLGTLHSKIIVGDERWVLSGSSNLDFFSPVFCSELDLAIDDAPFGRRIVDYIQSAITHESVEEMPCGLEAKQALRDERRALSVSRLCDLLIHDIQ